MSSEELTQLAYQVFSEQKCRKSTPKIEARFYAYANLNHTVRLRDGCLYLRISDMMVDAPVSALRAIVGILLLKLDRRKIRPELETAYRTYSQGAAVRDRAHVVRRIRGRKIVGAQTGKFFNLGESFGLLNSRYFQGLLRVSTLTWSRTRTKRILGHYDHCHDTIVISRSLDAGWVPPLLFEYILFHEMLHAHLGDRYSEGKRFSHHREFREQEKTFEQYPQAKALVKQFSARVR